MSARVRMTVAPASRPRGLLQRKCSCGKQAAQGEQCAECAKKKLDRSLHTISGRVIQRKLTIGASNDPLEWDADRIAGEVLAKPAHSARSGSPRVQRVAANASTDTAPTSVERVLAGSGTPLEPALRRDMEQRFGHNFSQVRVHAGAAAEESARDVDANAYTVGEHVVFGAGHFAPATHEGRRLIAHELAHVVQQSEATGDDRAQGNLSVSSPLSSAGSSVVRRQKRTCKTEADCQKLVKQGKWCRDSEETGKLHPGLQCYRDIPARKGYPRGKQECFSKDTGKFVESSPDFYSAVSGQKADGTCDIPMGITDPPQPFTQRGRRPLGHLIADIATEDPDVIGRQFGRLSGVAMGIALPHGIDSDLAKFAIPAIMGYLAGELGERGLPRLNSLTRKHGFLPTISLGAGSKLGLSLGVGLEKRDRPLPIVPVNTYLTLGLDSSLALGEEPDQFTFLAKVGVRIDPGKQGGVFAVGSVGAGVALGADVSGAALAEVGAGIRATDFLDVQLVREEVSGGPEGGTYWLTLKLVAPQRVFEGHPKAPAPRSKKKKRR